MSYDLYAWGLNTYGRLGLGDLTNRNTPTFVSNGWKFIDAGGNRSLGIKENGDLYSWGSNSYGQLGLS